MSAPPTAAYVMSEPHLSGFRVILGYDTLAEAQDAQAALSSAPIETVGEIDAMFWKWLGERGLQPDPEMNGTVDWLDIITALDEHERELLRPVPVDASAVKGARRRFRHLKRGSTYEHVGVGLIQGTLTDNDAVVIYRSEDDGRLWVRGIVEFWDGRFEETQPVPAPDSGSLVREALRGALEWDKARGYRMPYRVRDPIYAALDALPPANSKEPG